MSHNLSQRILLLGWFRVGVGKGGLSHFIYLFYKLLYRYVVKFNLKNTFPIHSHFFWNRCVILSIVVFFSSLRCLSKTRQSSISTKCFQCCDFTPEILPSGQVKFFIFYLPFFFYFRGHYFKSFSINNSVLKILVSLFYYYYCF